MLCNLYGTESEPVDQRTYLERIGLDGAPAADLDGLARVQWAHMSCIPFENLNVFFRRPLNLATDALYDKVVAHHRGGYCFELNTLYAALLGGLGFEPVPHLARVWLRSPVGVPPRNHLVHTVRLGDQRWLTDVGFGARAPRQPLAIDRREPVDDGDGQIQVRPDAEFGYMVERHYDGDWQPQYSFDLDIAQPADIRVSNHYTETWPESHFLHLPYCGLFTTKGRTGLAGFELTIREGDAETRTTLTDVGEWLATVRDVFGMTIELAGADEQRLLETRV